MESAAELSTVTRWQIGGSGISDSGVPPEPFFGIGAGQNGGTVELSGVSFTDLTNTRTATAATLTLHYWDELKGQPTIALGSAVGIGDQLVALSATGSALAGSFIQIEAEVIRVEEVQNSGMRYRVTRGMHGSTAAALRYETDAADSFDLGESFTLVGFSGDVSQYEAPPLAQGRRVRTPDEVDVGLGLAQALDLHVGTTLAAQLPSGREVRFSVVGIIDALRNEGLVAYVQAPRLRAAIPFAAADIAVKLTPGASLDRVRNILISRGTYPQKTGGIAQDSGLGSSGRTSFLRILAALLRSVAVLDGLVCVYALAQMLALIARERRRAVAVVRALGASRAQVFAVFGGAALVLAAVATPIGIAVQRGVLGPAVARIAASYVSLSLGAGGSAIAVVLVGVAVATALAAGWATRSATADAIVTPLRED